MMPGRELSRAQNTSPGTDQMVFMASVRIYLRPTVQHRVSSLFPMKLCDAPWCSYLLLRTIAKSRIRVPDSEYNAEIATRVAFRNPPEALASM